MNYIINIHTTSENALVSLNKGPAVLGARINPDIRQHAAFLHTSIHKILQDNDIRPAQLNAIGVTGGPGSYTGIRVGLATAKGLCFALNIPLMIFNTLEVMAFAVIQNRQNKNALYCPLVDARRMEVFTAVYDPHLQVVNPPSAKVLDETSFRDLPQSLPVYFFGSGVDKFQKLTANPPGNFNFLQEALSPELLAEFSWKQFKKNEFENLSFSTAFYVKEFYSTMKAG